MKGNALFNQGCTERYWLWRGWDSALPRLTVCMANPSDADHERNDPTIRWLLGYAKKNDFGELSVVNFHSHINPSSKKLHLLDPPSERNLDIVERFTTDREVLCAWGAVGARIPGHQRTLEVLKRHARALVCLDLTKDGHPVHPLRKNHSLTLKPWG